MLKLTVQIRTAPMESWREIAAKVIRQFGYLVAESTDPRKVGEILSVGQAAVGQAGKEGELVDQPLRIAAEATEQEFARQCRFLKTSHVGQSCGRFYYRVESD
jgi:hypothetical protein